MKIYLICAVLKINIYLLNLTNSLEISTPFKSMVSSCFHLVDPLKHITADLSKLNDNLPFNQ